jgi:hypothetical protein
MARSRRFLGKNARSLTALSLTAVALGACNLLTGLDADYQLKGSEVTAEGGAQDSTSGLDGQVADGATTVDGAQPPNDAGGEGGGNVDAAVRYCDQVTKGPDADFLCSDFEEAALGANGIPIGWTGVVNNIDVGGTAKLELKQDTDLDGKPTWVLDVTSSSQATISRQTRFHRTFIKNNKAAADFLSYEVDFDFRFLSSELNYQALGLLVFTKTTASEHGIASYISQPEYTLSREAPIGVKYMNDKVWHHASVRLSHAVAGTPFNRTIKIDQTVVDDNTTGHTLEVDAPTEFRIGVHNTSSGAGSTRVQFDDIVVRRQ